MAIHFGKTVMYIDMEPYDKYHEKGIQARDIPIAEAGIAPLEDSVETIKVALAGIIAEELFFEKDLESLLSLSEHDMNMLMLYKNGGSKDFFEAADRLNKLGINDKCYDILRDTAILIGDPNIKKKIDTLAQALMIRTKLNENEIISIIEK